MPWEKIVNEHGEALFRVAFRFLRNAQDSEDVTQEVLLEAFRMPGVPDAPLLRRMAAFRAIDRLRRRVATERFDEATCGGHRQSSQPEIEVAEKMELVQTAISKLPEQQARCFWLRYVEGLSNQQIANAVGISASTVSTALHKARHKLRESLQTDVERIDESK